MKSKLFTPKLHASQATAIESVETAEIFMNPPTHAEVPRYYGPCGALTPHNLSMNGSGAASTKGVERRQFVASPQEKTDY